MSNQENEDGGGEEAQSFQGEDGIVDWISLEALPNAVT